MTKKVVLQATAVAVLIAITGGSCSSVPKVKHKIYKFPAKRAFVKDTPKRPYARVGQVRTKVNYPTLDVDSEEQKLCENYFNKAALDLVRRARENGADAVIEMRSVVFTADGKHESLPRPECSDDGDEGQVLAEGVAVKWLPSDPRAAEAMRRSLEQKYGQGYVPKNDENTTDPLDSRGALKKPGRFKGQGKGLGGANGGGEEQAPAVGRDGPSAGEEDRVEIVEPEPQATDSGRAREAAPAESSPRQNGAPNPFGGPVLR